MVDVTTDSGVFRTAQIITRAPSVARNSILEWQSEHANMMVAGSYYDAARVDRTDLKDLSVNPVESIMRTEVFDAKSIDDAVERILEELKEDAAGGSARSSGRHNVIYFDGWDGLGASAVLRVVGRRLTPATPAGRRTPAAAAGLEFSHIFHIDCSKWESKRAMQKMIAEQLKLPASVMELFAAQDEEDDYKGVGKGSRAEIGRVAEDIREEIQKLRRFLLIFHNGSSEETDLGSLGFPLLDQYSRSKVLWSFQGRFRFYPRTKVDRALKNTRTTDVFLSVAVSSSDTGGDKLMSGILHHEAEEIAREMANINTGGIDWHAAATNCFLYVMKIRSMGSQIIDYDMSAHACNYWRCDGIVQALQQGDIGTDDGVDKLWLSSDALHREIQLDEDYYQNLNVLSQGERHLHKRMACWTSPAYGFMLIPDPEGQIAKGMFQQFDKLCVLKLSACKFNFTSPPFVLCHNLRFLWLDHCQEGSKTAEAVEDEDIHLFLQRLWVLDVRYSNKAFLSKEMMNFMTQLRELNVVGEDKHLHFDLMNNVRRLRVKEFSGPYFTFSRDDKMELFDMSVDHREPINFHIFSSSNLKTVIIDGSSNLTGISLTKCVKLKNIFLSGSFPDLRSIDITDAPIESLDLTAVRTPNLDELYLDCEKLCAILWPPTAEGRSKRYLDKLRIDTTKKEGTTEHTAGEALGEFNWQISVRDARILQSLESVKDYFSSNHAHVEISSPSYHPYVDDTGRRDDKMKNSSGQHVQEKLKQLIMDTAIYADVAVTLKGINKQQKQANEGDTDALAIMSICPDPPCVPSQGCYIHIDDQTRAKLQATSANIPAFVCDSAKILHVHDSVHVTSILGASSASPTWNQLEWCLVERCPKLGCVFSPLLDEGLEGTHKEKFKELRTFWASHLLKARHIWKWNNGSSTFWYNGGTFENVTFLHVEYCPRLTNIIQYYAVRNALDKLETLEIMWCGDLSMAFHFYDTFRGWIFKKLKHIRLHELPKLLKISNFGFKMYMPELKTIKIRGCWSLSTLPIVDSNNVVECDCEKDWWDRLEWESAEHARKYKLRNPRHYKKTMLKGSVLSWSIHSLWFRSHAYMIDVILPFPFPVILPVPFLGVQRMLPVISSSFRLLGLSVHRSALPRDGSSINEEVKEEDIKQFLQRLWVLDVRHSNHAFLSKEMMDFMTQLRELNVLGDDELWHVNLVQSQLHNIHKLRIKETTVDSRILFSGMDKMELLELSRNYSISVLSEIYVKSCRSLKTFIINGFDSLREITLSRCAKLKNILLSGSFVVLHKIHIIGAGVETLDLSAVKASNLDELCLLDCEKLCAIFWPQARYMNRLRIDTTQKEGTTEVSRERTTGKPPSKFDWHISVRDPRILQSLESVKDYFGSSHAHVEISSPSHHPYVDDAGSRDDKTKSRSGQHVQEKLKQLIMDTAIYADVTVTMKGINKQQKQANEGDTDALAIMSICPTPPSVPFRGCSYIHIDDQTRAKLQATSATIPAFICDSAKILHVHDSLSVTNIAAAPLASGTWNQLEWCRIERCPKLECVFSPHLGVGEEGSNIHTEMFKKLRTTWASDLPITRYIWKLSGKSTSSWSYGGTFEDLTLLHIDCCPRLVNAIYCPLAGRNDLDRLETLEIIYCSDLSVVFHAYHTPGQPTTMGWWMFKKLKHIRLHELPKLKKIGNAATISMPELETIKIRGCWSLRTLPIVETENVMECDCEKEWWDGLEWERAEHAIKYKPTHPRHYKKTMLKGSVLRLVLFVEQRNKVIHPVPLLRVQQMSVAPSCRCPASRHQFQLSLFLAWFPCASICTTMVWPCSSSTSCSLFFPTALLLRLRYGRVHSSPPVQDTELAFSILPCEKFKNKNRAERSGPSCFSLSSGYGLGVMLGC
ncbi:hypothetical protein EJB05_29051, partial [Eragrostis curvula]